LQQAADMLAAIEPKRPGHRAADARLKATTPAAPRTTARSAPVTVRGRRHTRSRRVAALVSIALALVGGLISLALLQSSRSPNTSSTSTSISTSRATAPAPPTRRIASRATPPAPPTRRITSALASGPNETVAGYINKNNIQETTVTHSTAGAPTVDLPVPEGWTWIPEGADAPYGGFVLNTPTNPNDPAKIIAIVEKLTGDVDTDKLLADAPGEVKNLPGYNGNHGQKSTLSGYPADLIGGSYTKNGVTRMVAQKTVVIRGKDGIYLLQLDAEGPQVDGNALMGATDVIDQKTRITP
jgi:hypothetical protein